MTLPDHSETNLRIAFMNSIGADIWRGGEKWMVNAAYGLAARGHDVVCIGRDNALWLKKAASMGLQTREYPIHADFDPFIISRLILFFRKRKVDLLCCNFEKDVRLGGIAARLAGVNCVFVRKGLSLIYPKLRYRLAYRYIVDRIITPAHFIKNQFKRFPWIDQDNIHVVHNGIDIPDTGAFSGVKLRELVNCTQECICILGAGHLFPQKGFPYLMEALKMVIEQGNKIKLAIAGSGDQGPLREIAEKLGILEQVHFLGQRNDIRELMYGADIFVLSSIDEGLPNVVLEAMSTGTAVIAADAGGTSEIISSGVDGFVVPVENSAALAEKISLLIQDSSLREQIGLKGLSTVRNSFTIEAMVDGVEGLFRLYSMNRKSK